MSDQSEQQIRRLIKLFETWAEEADAHESREDNEFKKRRYAGERSGYRRALRHLEAMKESDEHEKLIKDAIHASEVNTPDAE